MTHTLPLSSTPDRAACKPPFSRAHNQRLRDRRTARTHEEPTVWGNRGPALYNPHSRPELDVDVASGDGDGSRVGEGIGE